MADFTQAQLRNKILQRLRVNAAGVSAGGNDAVLVDEAIDSAHSELRAHKPSLVPFAKSAIPDWAQEALMDYVAAAVKPFFGFEISNNEIRAEQRAARLKLLEQLTPRKHNRRTVAEYF